jgi:hypothetical protein
VLNPVKNGKQLSVDSSGNLLVTGSFSVSGGNAAASTTAAAVPAQADYIGFSSGGNLVGVSSTNALPIQAATYGTVAPGTAATQSELMGAIVQISTIPAGTDGQQLAIQGDASGSLRINPYGNVGSIAAKSATGAGNTTVTLTVPSAKKWIVYGFLIKVVIANSGAIRGPGWNVDQSVSNTFIGGGQAGVLAPINATSFYGCGPSVPLSGGFTNSVATIPAPVYVLGPGYHMNFSMTNGVAGDTITVNANVLELND